MKYLFLFLVFFFCTHGQFTISLKYSRNRTYSCHLTRPYINFRSDTYKLYPRYLLADVLKMCKGPFKRSVFKDPISLVLKKVSCEHIKNDPSSNGCVILKERMEIEHFP